MMRSGFILALLSVAVAFWTAGAGGQTIEGQTIEQLRLRWGAYPTAPAPMVAPNAATTAPAPPPAPDAFTVLERSQAPGPLPRQRNPQLSAEQLVVVAVNGAGEMINTQLIPDPRILRAETIGPTGEMSSRVLHRADVEFLLTIPDDPALTELRLYKPRWTGTTYVLDLVGTIALR
jgi:hypothetical protein